MRALVLLLVGCLGLAGCGHTKNDASVEQDLVNSERETVAQCEQRKAEQANADAKMMIGMSPKAQEEFARSLGTERIVKAATGKYDECRRGTNIHDVQIAEVTEKNKTVRNIIPSLIAGAIGIRSSDNQREVAVEGIRGAKGNTQNTVTGDGNEFKQDQTSTASVAETHSSVDGEGASGTISNPGVAGPNQSTNTSETNNGIVPEGSTLAGAEEPIAAEHIGAE